MLVLKPPLSSLQPARMVNKRCARIKCQNSSGVERKAFIIDRLHASIRSSGVNVSEGSVEDEISYHCDSDW
jgi:hypothetical protein